jgi:hypothetical protein
MNECTWRSQYKYRHRGGIGYVILNNGHYTLTDINTGVIWPVTKEKGEALQGAEIPKKVGRTPLFNEPVEARSVTLPVIIWDTLDKPYSVTIEKIIKQQRKIK